MTYGSAVNKIYIKIISLILLLLIPLSVSAAPINNINIAEVDANGYLKVNVAVGDLSGATINGATLELGGTITPADGLTTPTDAINMATFLLGYNTSTWDILRTVGVGDNASTGLFATGIYGFDGTNWDRIRIDANGSIYVNQGALSYVTDSIANDTTANSYVNVTTNVTTAIKATGGILSKIIINSTSIGATSVVALYDIATAGCTGTPASGYISTLGTTTVNVIYELNLNAANGICAVTTGGTAANLTFLYR